MLISVLDRTEAAPADSPSANVRDRGLTGRSLEGALERRDERTRSHDREGTVGDWESERCPSGHQQRSDLLTRRETTPVGRSRWGQGERATRVGRCGSPEGRTRQRPREPARRAAVGSPVLPGGVVGSFIGGASRVDAAGDSTAWRCQGSTKGSWAAYGPHVLPVGPSDCTPREMRMVNRGHIRFLEE